MQVPAFLDNGVVAPNRKNTAGGSITREPQGLWQNQNKAFISTRQVFAAPSFP